MASGQPVIELRGIHKSFGDNVVLAGLDLDVLKGEALAIIGVNGSGKSVLLKVMSGLLEADEGVVRVHGADLRTLQPRELVAMRRKVAYVFQSDALFDSMNILENVTYGLREHTKLGEAEMASIAERCLALVDLEPSVLTRMPAELSGGMKKRVGLARAIASQPEVILYDEPTGGLDPQNITRIGQLIRDLNERLAITSVFVTHDMKTAFTVADRVALLDDGVIVHVGPPASFAHADHPAVAEFAHGPGGFLQFLAPEAAAADAGAPPGSLADAGAADPADSA
jgi:phospholipid/cholesterol/gamma-HCH transport system ATP-binding protein